MLRLAACMATKAGPRLTAVMVEASGAVMGPLACHVDAEIVRDPDRYQGEGGGEMWDRIMGLLDAAEAGGTA